ncbi:glycoside hydrolase family 5 protein [Hypholoma sublateritium FD-334 SS-4]|uniref:glucan 1,3-beta-glucosidase n=1 Tax=Hypholoma sublateritium (strain FD-334 SS-4) TaxID=945553 RepID=A0A0D2LAB5_HYPSF|nr:glycoside hydrolase family 5 protein [Hypholoma sublateritium FD-334 SS-4]
MSFTPLSTSSPAESSQQLSTGKQENEYDSESRQALASAPPHQKTARGKKRTGLIITLTLIAVIVVFLAVFLPVYLVVVRKHKSSTNAATSAGGGSGVTNPDSPTGAVTGGNGSVIKLSNGTEFTYTNAFGGFWIQDPADPYNQNAQPNSWTPPLNTSWTWGKDRIYGVNLGGLFVLEPFITPAIFQRYPTAVDEFTLSQAMTADTANGGINQLESHYDTFITEQDIAQIAGAGLNFLRIPIAFWAIETWEGEPYLAKTSWAYFLRVLGWARKYGLRVCLDLHAVPGSQNGYNHSGRTPTVNFMAGNMGLANAQRTLYYIRILTEFISQPEYRNLIPVFGIVNEALVATIGMDQITSFYLQAHTMIRNITGTGEGHGPYIAIHDAFQPLTTWENFLQGSDRIIMDEHPYFSFGGVQLDPIGIVSNQSGIPGGKWPLAACNSWGASTNDSRKNFGVTIGGEFAASPNDCGLYLRGVNITSENPFCSEYDAWESYNGTMKAGIQNFVMATFDALGDWFFWTWKIAPSQAGRVEAPLWSYQLGLEQGWIPKDPRTAFGMCTSLNATISDFSGTFAPWQTGTPSSIPTSSSAAYPWPPATISSADVAVTLMPTYTNTGVVITMPPATFTAAPSSKTSAVNGWFDTLDTSGGVTAVAGCVYPDEYVATFVVTPTAPCTGPTSATPVDITSTPVVVSSAPSVVTSSPSTVASALAAI